VLRSDAGSPYHRLVAKRGLPRLISIVAGVLAIALVWRSWFKLARYIAAVAGVVILFPSRDGTVTRTV